MIPLLPAASVLVPALIGLAGSVLQISWGSHEGSDAEAGASPSGGLGAKLAGANFATTAREKVGALNALLTSRDFKGLARRVGAQGKDLRLYVSGALDMLGDTGSKGPGSGGASPSDASLAAECEQALADLDLFLAIVGLIAGAKEAALIAEDAWVTEAKGLETVIADLVEEMASVDESLQELRRHYNPKDDTQNAMARARIHRLVPVVRNCQSAAVSRMTSLQGVLNLGLKGVEPLLAAAKGACSRFPEPDATSLTPLGVSRSTLDGWVLLVTKDIAAAEKAFADLEKVAAPILGHDLFNHLESFRPYKLEHVTRALDEAQRAFD